MNETISELEYTMGIINGNVILHGKGWKFTGQAKENKLDGLATLLYEDQRVEDL